MKYILFFMLLSLACFAQEVKISGVVKDMQNNVIESALIVVHNQDEKTIGYTYSLENGSYSIMIEKTDYETIQIILSCLGYSSKKIKIDPQNKTLIIENVVLEKKIENLKEVIVETNQRIKINQDTTTIKIAAFSNQTEQTIEDILKKLPGIEVQKDGTIKAHGKSIDKLLIEGEDLFDKNYKLLSKNLDAKVLDAVQIIDAFEDNPILKKMNNSDKVALNLKLKKDKQNIWFGNVAGGVGIVTENRWKEGINLGLLKKTIKLFYLADYNNSGEKASSLIQESTINSDFFGQDRIEKVSKKQYTISSNENSTFSKSQSIFNDALFNSLSFTSKIKPTLTIRGIAYFTKDNQLQNSLSETIYNINENPITNSEASKYSDKKTLSSGEIELKYIGNEDNYLTNLFIYKNNPDRINSDLLFNSSKINQVSKIINQTFYNHFNHSYSLSNRTLLNNYIYVGNDNLNEKNNLKSPFLNTFLQTNPDAVIMQFTVNKNLYYGIKSKLISRFKRLEYVVAFQYENSKESIVSNFTINNIPEENYKNNTNLRQTLFSLENGIRYNFNSKIDFTATLNYVQNHFNRNESDENYSIFNPTISFNLKKTSIGNFKLSYSENNSFPQINYLTTNYLLSDYNSFDKGINATDILRNKTTSLIYTFFNDEKRFSVNTNLSYINSRKTINSDNTITKNFTFKDYAVTNGGESYNGTFNIVNYLRRIKWATKLETHQTWNQSPTKVNSDKFTNLRSYNSQYTFSATTYYALPINFDFGFSYNYHQTNFNNIITSNKTKNAFVNCNYKITRTWLFEANSTFYEMNAKNYTFINIITNYTPEKSRFSYRLLFNNVSNQNEFTLITLDNYTSQRTTIKLVPRYLLATIKYRF